MRAVALVLFTLVVVGSVYAVASYPWAETNNCTLANLDGNTFVQRWNDATSRLKVGTWQLGKYNGSARIRQTLDGPTLLLSVKVDSNQCVTRADIKSLRDDTNPYAAMVAWLMLAKVTSPTSSADERNRMLKELTNGPRLSAGGEYSMGEITYEFREELTRNCFSSYPKPKPKEERPSLCLAE